MAGVTIPIPEFVWQYLVDIHRRSEMKTKEKKPMPGKKPPMPHKGKDKKPMKGGY